MCVNPFTYNVTGVSEPPCSGVGPPLTTTLPTDPTTPTDVRLPLMVMPIHYDLMLKPDIYTGNSDTFSFSGDVSITITCMKATDVITLHINKLDIAQSDVTLAESGPNVNSWTEDKDRQFMKVLREWLLE
jgi:aminopeptidase N